MTVALASLDDLEARMGDVDAVRALTALEDASLLIHTETSSVWLEDGVLVADIPRVVVTVCCKVAQRVMSNTQGIETTSLGTFTESYSNATNDVFLTRSERRVIKRAAGLSGIGSITLESPYRTPIEDIYMTVAGGGDPLPMGPWPTHE